MSMFSSHKRRLCLKSIACVASCLAGILICQAVDVPAIKTNAPPAKKRAGGGPENPELKFKLPPPPVLTPQEALKTFKLAPGFRIEVVAAEPLSQWTPRPADWKGAVVTDDSATLNGDKGCTLRASKVFRDVKFSATVTIAEPAKNFGFFGNGWSAWADATFSDGGARPPTT